MAKKKNTPVSASVEEVDLFAIDIDALDLDFSKNTEEKKSSKKSEKFLEKSEDTKKTTKTEKKSSKSQEIEMDKEILAEIAEELGEEFKDDFSDSFDDDFDFDEENSDTENSEDHKGPKDFFTDKRRQKTLKKFLDIEVPAEFLQGLDDNMQILFKK